MKHRLSFAYFNIISDNIVEVIADDGIEITLEMVEESHEFISAHFFEPFGMLINRVNNYSYSFEAQLSIASYEHLTAIAFVYYSNESKIISEKLSHIRTLDDWNYKTFSGLELGWQQAFDWLQQQLITTEMK